MAVVVASSGTKLDRFSVAFDSPPTEKIEKLDPSSHWEPERHEFINKSRSRNHDRRYLGLEDIDFGSSPSHVGAIRVDRTWMGFALTGAPAQPLARQVRQNTAVAGITALERSLRGTVTGLVL
jgi:hypothetical protein